MSRRKRESFGVDEDDALITERVKKRRLPDGENIEERLETLISRIGEKSKLSLECNLEGLFSVLEDDLPNYKVKIMRILCQCVVDLPDKLTVYTCLVGLLNASDYACGGEFVEMLVRNLKESLKTGEWEKARMMSRFLADLVNCNVLVAASVLQMFENFVEVTMEDNIPQVRSDVYVYIVLSSLPWVGRELYEKKAADLDKLMDAVNVYISKRQKIHLPALSVWSVDDPHPQDEYLDCLWAQIRSLQANKWVEKQISRLCMAFDNVLCNALQHTLPQIIPPSHNEEMIYPIPSVVFRLFSYTDVPEHTILPGSHAFERYLVEDHLNCVIHSIHMERKHCAVSLLSYPAEGLPLNYIIIEVMFAQLFRLPCPPHIELFYGSMLIDLCKLLPGFMPQVLAQASEMLFEKLDYMNTICIERFARWFSYHLSNFQFRWTWEDWSAALSMDKMMPRPTFIKEVLKQCMRFSFHQRICDSIPENFSVLMAEKPHPEYRYGDGSADFVLGKTEADQLIVAIKSKCSPDEAAEVLRDLPNKFVTGEDNDMPAFHPLKIDVFVSTLLFLGAKSFSHSFAAIAKFYPNLKALAESQDGQLCTLRTIHNVWRTHEQMIVVLVDKLLRTEVFRCETVVNWIFSDEMQNELTSFYVWEILHGTISKMTKQVGQLQSEVEESRDKLDAAKRKKADGMEMFFDEEVPTEDMIDHMEERLEMVTSQQKNLFLIIFQRFIMVLADHLAECDRNKMDHHTPWYKWIIERLQHILLQNHELVFKYISTLESLLFTADIDIHILQIFQQFCSLRS